jgi:hypothetical protein
LANGALRIIDSPSQSCNANEAALNWSQNGGSGSGQTVANHVMKTDTDPVFTLLEVPAFGVFSADPDQCVTNPGNDTVSFQNTSSETVIMQNGAKFGASYQVLNAGDSVNLGTAATIGYSFYITKGTGSSSRVAEIKYELGVGGPGDCSYVAVAHLR